MRRCRWCFWYVGLIPDLATLRDRANQGMAARRVYGFMALGWRGAARHWKRYQTAYLLLAGLAAPLVVSVHSVVGMDFAAAIVPGWHSTIFPPYFVAGAIFSGFAMVVTLAVPMRRLFHLEEHYHAQASGKLREVDAGDWVDSLLWILHGDVQRMVFGKSL